MPPEINWLKAAGDFIGSAGMPGVVAALLYVIKILWAEITDRNETIAALQDKRALEAGDGVRQTVAALAASTAQNASNAEAVKDIGRLQRSVLDVVNLLPGAIEGLNKALDRNADKIDNIGGRR